MNKITIAFLLMVSGFLGSGGMAIAEEGIVPIVVQSDGSILMHDIDILGARYEGKFTPVPLPLGENPLMIMTVHDRKLGSTRTRTAKSSSCTDNMCLTFDYPESCNTFCIEYFAEMAITIGIVEAPALIAIIH